MNFDLTGSVFGMEWAFGAGATNDRSDNHHTGSLYASYDPEIPPHLADQFLAYEKASIRPDYVEFIGIETFREFWSQELSSGWTNTTDWAEATLSGSWLSLPGGDARFVVGAAWRSTGLKTDNKRNAYGHNSNRGSYWTEEPNLGSARRTGACAAGGSPAGRKGKPPPSTPSHGPSFARMAVKR